VAKNSGLNIPRCWKTSSKPIAPADVAMRDDALDLDCQTIKHGTVGSLANLLRHAKRK